MRASFVFPALASVFLALFLAGNVEAQTSLPAPPSDFDSKATAPPDLPKVLDIPKNMRIEVGVWRKIPIRSTKPIDPNNSSMLMDPDLESAVIERGEGDVHAIFNWQGGRSSEAFVIKGLCYRKVNFAYPDAVIMTEAPMNFWLNRQDLSGTATGNFPGIGWYVPSKFVGTASLYGTKVLVFAQNPPKGDAYPEAYSVCLDSKTHSPLYMDDGIRVFSFTYIPSPNVQITPQGPYLEMIKRHLGHYP
jgi:hypothetical protein